MGTQYCGDIGFLLGFHRHVERLGIDNEVTSLCDIFFQYHYDVVAITQRNVKLHVIVLPIFNVVLISDKDENAILFHLSKYSYKLYGNIVCMMQIKMRAIYTSLIIVTSFTCFCRNLLSSFFEFTI